MSDNKLAGYFFYKKVLKLLLLLSGSFPVEKPNLFYRLIPCVHTCFVSLKFIGAVGALSMNLTNVLMVTKHMGAAISYITVLAKLGCMNFHRPDIKKLYKTLDAYFDVLVENSQFTNTLLNDFTTLRLLTWTNSMLNFSVSTINYLLPLIFIINQHRHHIHPVKYVLPGTPVYPWTITPNGYLYKLHYGIEVLGSYAVVSVTSGFDSMFAFFGFLIMGRLREISYRLIHLNESNDSDKVVRHCIFQYRMILECRNLIQQVFGPVVLWMLIFNAIILCLGMFRLSQMKTMNVGQGIFFTMYVFTKLLQTYIYGYIGSKLITESEYYRDAIYATDWHGNKRLMSSLVIMLAQKPLTMTACHFSIISVDIFKSVINTTISYFFLLQTLDQKQA